jgi:hypothetical protein
LTRTSSGPRRSYYRSLCLDTNLLVLFLLGQYRTGLLDTNRRTRRFGKPGYRWLLQHTVRARKLITTPHILTETSNLIFSASSGLRGPYLSGVVGELVRFISMAEELKAPAEEMIRIPCFRRLGLTDAAITDLDSSVAIATDDHKLATELWGQGIEVLLPLTR